VQRKQQHQHDGDGDSELGAAMCEPPQEEREIATTRNGGPRRATGARQREVNVTRREAGAAGRRCARGGGSRRREEETRRYRSEAAMALRRPLALLLRALCFRGTDNVRHGQKKSVLSCSLPAQLQISGGYMTFESSQGSTEVHRERSRESESRRGEAALVVGCWGCCSLACSCSRSSSPRLSVCECERACVGQP